MTPTRANEISLKKKWKEHREKKESKREAKESFKGLMYASLTTMRIEQPIEVTAGEKLKYVESTLNINVENVLEPNKN